MNFQIRDFTIKDYEGAIDLWKTDPNIGLGSADDKDNIERFLDRNPGLSKVVCAGEEIVATVLCGHDGRRGHVYHLFVDEKYRRKGLGRKIVDNCLEALRKEGINKCHLFPFKRNELGKNFWKATAWKERDDIVLFSKDI